ncbi:MAG: CoA transferase [Pseudomonadales bacterium]|nr:CoA transferase [Pseudomonadales bacterium]
MPDESLIFEGLKVLDVGSWIAAPVAATMLADRGAEVLKVEVPVAGDGYRNYALAPFTPTAQINYTWALDARNKRSIAINLKSDEGMDILHRLIRDCDVFITNQPLPLRRALKLTYEDIKSLNETMIYASLTPYGEEGPDRDNEAFDLVAYWNRSGLMDKMRHGNTQPVQALAGMGDHPTSVAMYASIVTGLLQRERTGKGTKVHTSLLANGIWSASCLMQAQLANADFSTMPDKPRLTGALYETKEGRWMQLSMLRTAEALDRLFVALEAFELLADERFSTLEARMQHGDELTEIFREKFLTKTSDEWLRILKDEHELPVERVTQFADLPGDPHLTLNRIVSKPVDDIGVDAVINDPVNVEGVARVGAKKAPLLGEHTNDVLGELGFDASAIEALKSRGIVG